MLNTVKKIIEIGAVCHIIRSFRDDDDETYSSLNQCHRRN